MDTETLERVKPIVLSEHATGNNAIITTLEYDRTTDEFRLKLKYAPGTLDEAVDIKISSQGIVTKDWKGNVRLNKRPFTAVLAFKVAADDREAYIAATFRDSQNQCMLLHARHALQLPQRVL